MSVERIFLLYRFTSRLYFHLPFLLIFFLQSNLSFLECGAAIAAYSILCSFFSKPIRKIVSFNNIKLNLVVGEVVKAVGLIVLAQQGDFASILIAQAVMATGYVIALGWDSEILRYESRGRNKEAEKTGNSLIFSAIFISGITGGFLATIDISLTLYASFIACFLSAIIAFLFPSIGSKIKPTFNDKLKNSGNYSDNKNARLMSSRESIIIISTYVTFRALILVTFITALPILYFKIVQVPLYIFGLLLGSYTIASVFSSQYWLQITTIIQNRFPITAFMYALVISSYGLVLGSNYIIELSYFVPILLGLVAGILRPCLIEFHHDTDAISALLNSVESLVNGFSIFLTLVFCLFLYLYGEKLGTDYFSYFSITVCVCLAFLHSLYQSRLQKLGNEQNAANNR